MKCENHELTFIITSRLMTGYYQCEKCGEKSLFREEVKDLKEKKEVKDV